MNIVELQKSFELMSDEELKNQQQHGFLRDTEVKRRVDLRNSYQAQQQQADASKTVSEKNIEELMAGGIPSADPMMGQGGDPSMQAGIAGGMEAQGQGPPMMYGGGMLGFDSGGGIEPHPHDATGAHPLSTMELHGAREDELAAMPPTLEELKQHPELMPTGMFAAGRLPAYGTFLSLGGTDAQYTQWKDDIAASQDIEVAEGKRAAAQATGTFDPAAAFEKEEGPQLSWAANRRDLQENWDFDPASALQQHGPKQSRWQLAAKYPSTIGAKMQEILENDPSYDITNLEIPALMALVPDSVRKAGGEPQTEIPTDGEATTPINPETNEPLTPEELAALSPEELAALTEGAGDGDVNAALQALVDGDQPPQATVRPQRDYLSEADAIVQNTLDKVQDPNLYADTWEQQGDAADAKLGRATGIQRLRDSRADQQKSMLADSLGISEARIEELMGEMDTEGEIESRRKADALKNLSFMFMDSPANLAENIRGTTSGIESLDSTLKKERKDATKAIFAERENRQTKKEAGLSGIFTTEEGSLMGMDTSQSAFDKVHADIAKAKADQSVSGEMAAMQALVNLRKAQAAQQAMNKKAQNEMYNQQAARDNPLTPENWERYQMMKEDLRNDDFSAWIQEGMTDDDINRTIKLKRAELAETIRIMDAAYMAQVRQAGRLILSDDSERKLPVSSTKTTTQSAIN